MIKHRGVLALFIFALSAMLGWAQSSSFYNLSTAEGLSDNKVNSAVRDKNGILWIGTSEGLNSFDGNRITTYYKNQYPEIQSDVIDRIIIDAEDRIWIKSNSHYLTMLDENRKFHKYLIGDTSDIGYVKTILYCPKYGVFAIKSDKHYFQGKNVQGQFQKTSLPFDTLISSDTKFIYKLKENKFAFYKNNNLVIIDYNSFRANMQFKLPGLCGVSYINDDEIIAFSTNGKRFYRISIKQQKILEQYESIKDQENKPISGNLRNIARIDSSRFLITTLFSGLYLFDIAKKSAFRWQHDPIDAKSLGGNNTYTAKYDSSGYVFVTTLTSGLHFFNINYNQIKSKPYFVDANKEIFDGFIQSITTDRNGVVWTGAQDRIIKWNPVTNTTAYIPCILPDGRNLSGKETFRVVHFDKRGNFWVGTSRNGLLVFDKDGKLKKHFTLNGKPSIPSNWINAICEDHEGCHWIGTFRGLIKSNKQNLLENDLGEHPVLSPLSNIPITCIWADPRDKMWIGTTRGVFCYDKTTNCLTPYTIKEGLISNTVYSINQDLFENTYFGTIAGLSILSKNGKIVNYTRGNGLQNNLCERILRDDLGYMWISNLNCILKYDPVSAKFIVFKNDHGFNHGGYRIRSAHKTKKGEMFWGTDKGLNWFAPEQISAISPQIRPVVNSLIFEDTSYLINNHVKLSFPFNASGLIFNFSSGELTGISKTQFLYKMEGLDQTWQKPASLGQAIYNKLPSGTYSFLLKASANGTNWIHSPYTVSIVILHPWWQTTWFRFLYVLIGLLTAYFTFRYFQKKNKERELNKILAYFSHSENENATVDDILWDICRNVIFKLDLEDCVIYMIDNEKQTLVQKAALGSKNPKAFEILNKIEIPVGKGIVGYVADTGRSIIVNDTSKDGRYILDDAVRYSEIAVPIIHENKVIGILDSENHKKNFFNKDHLHTLENIAASCAGKISRAIALDAMKKSKMEVMELNMKMAESKFLNLRLQMNPHFLFNSLSSIQHLIVSQQTTKAYKYLTVFSNFIRSLLNYADINFIQLDEELKILKMYIELEALRFDDSFLYDIIIDEKLENDEVFVPSLMVQPFVENAIWHGLLHKEGSKQLTIDFNDINEEFLVCIIEDNGIGRANSLHIQKNKISAMAHESKGIGIIEERLRLLQQKTGKPAHVTIEDLFDSTGKATGTKVLITIPYYNPEER